MSPTRPTLRENLRAMPSAAWVLFAGTFVNRLGTFVIPFLTLYLTKRGYTPPEAGLGIAGYGLGAIFAQGFGGLLADRLGRRNTIAMSMFSAAALTLVLWRVSSLAVILPVVTLLGTVAELYRPASSALIADLALPHQRVAAFTTSRLAVNLGWAVGLAVGGFLADRSFGLLFVGDAATSASFGVIALAALPHGRRSARHEERRGEASKAILADKGFLLFLGAVLLTAIVYVQSGTTFPLHVRASGLRNSDYGLLLALNGIIVVIAELPITSWTQHRPRTRMIALGSLVTGLAFAFVAVARTMPSLVGVVVIWTLGEIVESPSASAFVADRAPEHVRGRYQAALGTMWGLAAVIGPIVGTALFHANQRAVWVGCGLAGVAAAWLAFAAGRRPVPERPVDVSST